MRVFQNSFVSGCLDPALAGRVDLQAYFQGAADLWNFLVKSSGALAKRMGTDHLRRLDGVSAAYFFPVYKSREEAFIGYLTPPDAAGKGKIKLLLSSQILEELDETAVGTWRTDSNPPFRADDYLQSDAVLTPDFEEAYRAYWAAHSGLSIAIPVSYSDSAAAARGESYGVRVGKYASSKWSTTTNAHLLFDEPGGFIVTSTAFSTPTATVTTKLFIEAPGAISKIVINPVNEAYAEVSEDDIPTNQPITSGGQITVVSTLADGTTSSQTLANDYNFPSMTPGPIATLPDGTTRVQIYRGSTAAQLYELELYTGDVDYCVAYNIPITIYGEGWFRYRNTNAAAILEHDFSAAELAEVTHVQSGDTIFFFHPNHPTLTLKRITDISWVVEELVLDALPEPPSGLKAIPSGFCPQADLPATERKYAVQNTVQYAVSAVYAGKESHLSNRVRIQHWSGWTQGAKVRLEWNAPTGEQPIEYNVWKKTAGMWGWIGGADSTEFTDTNLNPSYQYGVTNTEPVFADVESRAGAGTFFEQRMVLSRYGEDAPHGIAFSAVGDIFNFFDHTPVTEDNAFLVTIATTEHAAIRWVMAQQARLMIFTENSEWIADTGNSTSGFSGLSARFRLNSRYGIHSSIPPLSTGGSLLFVRSDARSVIDYGYEVTRDAMSGVDRNVLSRHLVEGDAITSMAYQQSPDSIIWFTTREGQLLSLTYLPEHEVYAWSRHTLAGGGRAVKVLATGAALKNRDGSVNYDADELYVIVSREGTFNIERLRPGITSDTPDLEEALTLDAAHIIRAGTAAPTSPLEGQGGVIYRDLATGEGGELEAGWEAERFVNLPNDVMLGYPVLATLKTLRPEPPEGSLMGRQKRVVSAFLRLRRAAGLVVRNAANPASYDCRVRETFNDALFTGDCETAVDGRWNLEGQVLVTSVEPQPAEILAIVYTLDFQRE